MPSMSWISGVDQFARGFSNLYNRKFDFFFEAVVAQLVEQLIRNQ